MSIFRLPQRGDCPAPKTALCLPHADSAPASAPGEIGSFSRGANSLSFCAGANASNDRQNAAVCFARGTVRPAGGRVLDVGVASALHAEADPRPRCGDVRLPSPRNCCAADHRASILRPVQSTQRLLPGSRVLPLHGPFAVREQLAPFGKQQTQPSSAAFRGPRRAAPFLRGGPQSSRPRSSSALKIASS